MKDKNKHVGVIPSSADADGDFYTREELDGIADRHAAKAARHCWSKTEQEFSIGRCAHEMTEELRNGKKKTPPNTNVCKIFAERITAKGIRNISRSTVHGYLSAYETRAALAETGTPPRLPISYYIAVSKKGLPMEVRGKLLQGAVTAHFKEHHLREQADRELLKLRTGNADPVVTVAQSLDELEATINRVFSTISKERCRIFDQGAQIETTVREKLSFLAVYAYQFAHEGEPTGAREATDE